MIPHPRAKFAVDALVVHKQKYVNPVGHHVTVDSVNAIPLRIIEIGTCGADADQAEYKCIPALGGAGWVYVAECEITDFSKRKTEIVAALEKWLERLRVL